MKASRRIRLVAAIAACALACALGLFGCSATSGSSGGSAGASESVRQVDMAFVKENKQAIKLVDVRSAADFGRVMPQDGAKLSHIPDAVNMRADRCEAEDGSPLPPEKIRDLFEKSHIAVDDQIVVYGDDDGRPDTVAKILADSGFGNVSVYAGGFADWASDESNELPEAEFSCC